MEAQWEEDDPHVLFWKRLLHERAEMFQNSPEYLRTLRQDYAGARRLQKLFGHIWREQGTDIFKLTAEACGENWDLSARTPDEEKTPYVQLNDNNDDVDRTREKSARGRLDLLQGVSEASEQELEKGKGQRRRSKGSRPKEEETARSRQEARRRRSGFYRRAGGSG